MAQDNQLKLETEPEVERVLPAAGSVCCTSLEHSLELKWMK